MLDCPIPVPDWYLDQPPGTCGPGDIAQCNMVFQARLSALAGGADDELTFDVSQSNFNKFQPVGMKFTAVLLADPTEEAIGGVVATAIDFAGTNYLLDEQGMNLTTFGIDSRLALSVFHLPELTPGAQDVVVKVSNVTSGVTIELFGFLYGFAQR